MSKNSPPTGIKTAIFYANAIPDRQFNKRFSTSAPAKPQVKFRDISSELTGEDSATIRERVIAARKRQQEQFTHKRTITCNARMGRRELKSYCPLDETTKELLKFAMVDLSLSARAYDRMLKVARTIADVAASDKITSDHIPEAIQYRSLDRQL